MRSRLSWLVRVHCGAHSLSVAVAHLVLVGHEGGHTIMTKIKSITVGLPVTELKRAVEWYRQLLGEVEEVNPAPGVWEFQIVPSGWLQLFESEINELNQSVMRFESHDIEASRMLASSLSINVDQIKTVPETVRYFEFGDPFGNRLSFYELLA
jgi:lactoylglutathione lyase